MEESQSTVMPVKTVQHSKHITFIGQNLIEAFIFKELKAFGATQFVAGIVQMTFGIPLIYSSSFSVAVMFGTIWWTGVWCSIVGVMNMFLHNSSSVPLIKAALLVNCLSTVIIGAGIALYSTSIFCTPRDESLYPTNISFAITGMLLLFAVVSLIISIAVFVLYLKHVLRF